MRSVRAKSDATMTSTPPTPIHEPSRQYPWYATLGWLTLPSTIALLLYAFALARGGSDGAAGATLVVVFIALLVIARMRDREQADDVRRMRLAVLGIIPVTALWVAALVLIVFAFDIT